MTDLAALLAKLRELEGNATKGPWAWSTTTGSQLKRKCEETAQDEYYATNCVISTIGSTPLACKSADRDMIATARNVMGLLLDVVEAAHWFRDNGRGNDYDLCMALDRLAAAEVGP